jgi:hypothetical protein
MKNITQLEFNENDFPIAEKIVGKLGFTQTAYTSTSDIIGLFCLPDRANQKHGCIIIKSKEFGFMFVSTLEDLHLERFNEPEPIIFYITRHVSKRDVNGNCYALVSIVKDGKTSWFSCGNGDGTNVIQTLRRHGYQHWQINDTLNMMPIREWNKLEKSHPEAVYEGDLDVSKL